MPTRWPRPPAHSTDTARAGTCRRVLPAATALKVRETPTVLANNRGRFRSYSWRFEAETSLGSANLQISAVASMFCAVAPIGTRWNLGGVLPGQV